MNPDPATPKTFVQYLRSFGPGIIVVLTWLGAGDIVEVGVAGGNFGYALMWVVALAILMRFLFVSLIAKYQLCNQRGEGVLDGLARLNRAFPLLLFVAAIVMGHIYGAYMTVGVGEACANLLGFGSVFSWALLLNGIAVGRRGASTCLLEAAINTHAGQSPSTIGSYLCDAAKSYQEGTGEHVRYVRLR